MAQYLWRFFIVWYICGVILVSLNILPKWLEWSNAVFLYTAGILAVFYLLELFGRVKGLIFSVVILIGTMYAESLGVKYGWIFGRYYYEQDFGIQLFGVPFTIGFAWIMVIATGLALVWPEKHTTVPLVKKMIYPVLAASFAVTMDLIIDPVSYQLKQYWVWLDTGPYYQIPNQNFIGWFLTALVIHYGLLFFLPKANFRGARQQKKRMQKLYVMILVMFIIIALVGKLFLAVLVTALLFISTLFVTKWVFR